MGLFTKDKKIKVVPRTEESKKGGKYLMSLLNKGVPDIPIREIEGLTPIQQQIQQSLGDILTDTSGSAKLARDELTKTLTDQYDPRTSDFYKGYREEAEDLKQQGITDIRQRANLGGMMLSSPTGAAEDAYTRQVNSNILQQLGQLYENERNRRSQAARDIQSLDSTNIANYAAIGGISEQQRAVEQAQSDAIYQAALNQVMFPYTYMSDIASALLGVQNQGVVMGGGLTDLGFAASTLSNMFSFKKTL